MADCSLQTVSYKSSAVAEMGDCARESGPKTGGAAVPFLGGAGSSSNIMWHGPWAEAYLHTKWHPNPSNRLAAIHQRHRQDIGLQDRQTDNGPIAQGEPFYKRSPPNRKKLIA